MHSIFRYSLCHFTSLVEMKKTLPSPVYSNHLSYLFSVFLELLSVLMFCVQSHLEEKSHVCSMLSPQHPSLVNRPSLVISFLPRVLPSVIQRTSASADTFS